MLDGLYIYGNYSISAQWYGNTNQYGAKMSKAPSTLELPRNGNDENYLLLLKFNGQLE